MSNYLVTGGAGFIGSHLSEELVRRGHRVRVADSLITGKRSNLDHILFPVTQLPLTVSLGFSFGCQRPLVR